MNESGSGLCAIAIRLVVIVVGAAVGTVPGFVASRTFLAPRVNNDLSDINNVFTALFAIAIGVVGALVGGFVANWQAERRRDRAVW
jgi:hypothetical protein